MYELLCNHFIWIIAGSQQSEYGFMHVYMYIYIYISVYRLEK
jgi:hypothetical protein